MKVKMNLGLASALIGLLVEGRASLHYGPTTTNRHHTNRAPEGSKAERSRLAEAADARSRKLARRAAQAARLKS